MMVIIYNFSSSKTHLGVQCRLILSIVWTKEGMKDKRNKLLVETKSKRRTQKYTYDQNSEN